MAFACPKCGSDAEHALLKSGLHTCAGCTARFLAPDSTYAVLATAEDPDGGEHIPIPEDLKRRWHISLLLGNGAMGVVYKATERDTGEPHAIKFLTKVANASLRERFHREAKMMGRVQHENVVQIHEAGETHGYPYLAMELVDGESLGGMLARLRRLPAEDAVRIIGQLLAGLEYCHAKGLIHRDIKLDNAMLTKSGVVKLADLGIARDTEDRSTRMTASGVLVGTPSYMAPEVLKGSEATTASDIYSVAVMLYELLTGTQPYTARTLYELVERHFTYQPPAPHELYPKLPVALSQLVMRGLSRNPEERPESAYEFAEALRNAHHSPEALMKTADDTPVPVAPPPPPVEKRSWLPVVFGLAVLGAGGALALRPAKPTPPAASATPSAGGSHPAYIEGKRHYDRNEYDKSFPLFVQAAEAGDRDAMFRLGASYTKARGTPGDATKGAHWYRKAAELGHIDAQVSIASALQRGAGVPKDLEEGFRWLLKAAEQNDIPAMCIVGQCYLRGDGVPRSARAAVEWLRKAASHDYPEACTLLGLAYLKGGEVEKDAEEAFRWLKRGAAADQPEALYNLSFCYAQGQGTQVDRAQAVKVLHQAADLAYGPAYTRLGDFHYDGFGVPRDPAKALTHYEKGAELGDPEGMRKHAQLLLAPGAAHRDPVRAQKQLERAVERGDIPAKAELAHLLFATDRARAMALAAEAAAEGNARGLYVQAAGTDDPEKARKLLRKAAELGDELAVERLKSLK